MESNNKLKDIPIDLIEKNPDNPRIYFRQEELDNLLVSINKYGVQVPISVYQDGDKYIIIDGERRWRTCKKLNLRTIPAIIQNKPTELNNLLMMFNIHSLREQWDLFTIASKITKVIDLLSEVLKRMPNESELSEYTGLNRSTIRRCKLLIELPSKYKEYIRKELEIPKSKQKLTEDFFIEMESSLKTVKRNYPELVQDIDSVRDNLIDKYRSSKIKNLVDFRQIAKLATAHKNVNYSQEKSKMALERIFFDEKASIVEVFNETVGDLYVEKRLLSTINNVVDQIESLSEEEMKDDDVRVALLRLKLTIDKILNEYE
jgi:ParB family transcriptional regulator, chromosome partitioning protein